MSLNTCSGTCCKIEANVSRAGLGYSEACIYSELHLLWQKAQMDKRKLHLGIVVRNMENGTILVERTGGYVLVICFRILWVVDGSTDCRRYGCLDYT